TTYLPVRALAQALGCEVAWVPETNTVVVNSGAAAGQDVSLPDPAQSASVPSGAAQTIKNLEAYFKDIKIELNGAVIVPKDVNGTVVDPFIVDGTTYLPVRALAQALGCDVAWVPETNTVVVNSELTAGQEVFLTDLTQSTSVPALALRNWSSSTDYDATGQQYDRSLVAMVEGNVPAGTITQYAQYDLGRKYEALTGRITPMKGLDAIPGSTHQINFYGDGELLYSSPVFSSSLAGASDAFNVDVSTVGVLKIEMITVRTTLASYATGLGIVGPMLTSN
ncbi:MAG TPA: stalk domain-containing protein, partial [Terriglobales bacterium]|nr:stalk domain-containing protein [Terriglobales bacterium]